ncbi:unnamed protein product, partial [Phaeothamnion confervicola]
MPASTPIGARRRYLCWNNHGSITSIDEGTHNVVEILPSDRQNGRTSRFQDTWGFMVGALSPAGAVFASPGEVDKDEARDDMDGGGGGGGGGGSGRRSVLYYKNLGRSGAAAAQWTKMLPACELVLLVAVGAGWAAAATNRRLVRVFTASGFQSEVFALPGPVVCMAGEGPFISVTYHAATPAGDDQSLENLVLDVMGRRELVKSRMCLSPKSILLWTGVQEDGMAVAMDSAGVVWALVMSLGWQWLPMIDTKEGRKNKTDLCWPVGILAGRLTCVVLKGGEEHPSTQPR